MLKEITLIEEKSWASKMFKKVNKHGEKVNVILNGIREVDPSLEDCPVDLYEKQAKKAGFNAD